MKWPSYSVVTTTNEHIISDSPRAATREKAIYRTIATKSKHEHLVPFFQHSKKISHLVLLFYR